ncbi:winged helix-turn-helix domain-containing protein [Aliivibrio logei]|uniref:Transcriptional regulator n=1 Tax=Aliivibrio logei TaxID=688 RepID=A0A1B9P177_ALILO|nr:winged helix-turn-helix domain-containing protein [Aliivibrio logei]OCH22071.1 transcriptional regulator [Aliivibrio logei]
MQKITIANLVLEPATRRLSNNADDAIILRPLPYNVFTLLLEQKGNCIDRDELFDVCWEGAIVTDQALTNVISGLRRNLIQLEAEGIAIKTVSKVGYLLTVDETVVMQPVIEPKIIPPVIDNIEPKAILVSPQAEDPLMVNDNVAISNDVPVLPTTEVGRSRVRLLTKPSLKSALIAFCLCSLIAAVCWYEKASSVPYFLVKENYNHFEIKNTDFYILNNTRGKDNIEAIQSGLESLNLVECNAEIYIRMYDSVYDDDTYSLKGYIVAKNSNRNSNYSLSKFSHENLPTIIANGLKRAKLICE